MCKRKISTYPLQRYNGFKLAAKTYCVLNKTRLNFVEDCKKK